jgi:hypothetical protein
MGGMVGMLVASVVDLSLLAYKDAPKPERAGREHPLHLALSPRVDPQHGTYELSLVGIGF